MPLKYIEQLLKSKAIAISLIICIQNINTSGQNQAAIQGRVTNEFNEPVESALISLFNSRDSALIKLELSDANGYYNIDKILPKEYYIIISHQSYLNSLPQNIKLISGQSTYQLQATLLKKSERILQEIEIKAKKSFIEKRPDRTIVNIDALISNAGTSALEALEKSPGVSVDENGLIKLKGRSGVSIFIDDKPIQLSGTELENYLRAIPTDQILRLELMPTPPARYDAAGNAGVINIVMKKDRRLGLNGNLNIGLTQGRYTRYNNSLSLFWNKNKLSLSTLLNSGYRASFQDLNIRRFYKQADLTPRSSFLQNSFIVKKSLFGSGKFGLDYYLDNKNSMGISFKNSYASNNDQTDNIATINTPGGNILQNILADNNHKTTLENQLVNLYWKKNLDSLGSQIYLDGDYVKYKNHFDQVFKNNISSPDNMFSLQDLTLGDLPSSIIIYALKSDWTKVFLSQHKIEAGIKFANTSTDNKANYVSVIEKDTSPDYRLSNQFIYNENIYAAYGNYSWQMGSISMQLGFRTEYTTLRGYQAGNPIRPDSSINNEYLSLFPSAFFNWPVDSAQNHIINFTYGRRIDRPYFQDLNPFISPLDKFTFYGGNPNLQPTYSNNFSLAHTFKNALTTSLNYSYTSDNIVETLEIVDTIYFSRPGNVGKNRQLSVSVEGAYPLASWYTLSGYLEGAYVDYKSKLYTEQLHSFGYYAFIQINNSFQLGKGWNAECRLDYQSDLVYAQLLVKSWGTFNFAFSKKIWKDAAMLKLSANDVFYTRRADGIINNLRLTEADWNSRLDSRNINLNFSYRFGKQIRKSSRVEKSGSEEEQRRVKN